MTPLQKARSAARVLVAAFTICVLGGSAAQSARAQQGMNADAMALVKLQKFLMKDVARRAYAKSRPDARKANNYLESFPPWAKQEMLEIVMMIMRNQKENATDSVDRFKSGGTGAFKQSLQPKVRSRLDKLVKKLSKDESFTDPENMEKMKRKMPKKYTNGS